MSLRLQDAKEGDVVRIGGRLLRLMLGFGDGWWGMREVLADGTEGELEPAIPGSTPIDEITLAARSACKSKDENVDPLRSFRGEFRLEVQ